MLGRREPRPTGMNGGFVPNDPSVGWRGQETTEMAGCISDPMERACDRPRFSPAALLDGMCRLAMDLLECDCSHTVVLQPAEESCVVAATYGHAYEQWASLRGLTAPHAAVRPLLDRLQGESLLQGLTARLPEDVIPGLPERFGVTWSVYIPLRWNQSLVGYQHAGYMGRMARFSPAHERILRGFADLGAAGMATIGFLGEVMDTNRVKDRFVAYVSHELRSGLSTSVGYSDLLLDGEYGALTDEERDVVQRMRTTSLSLLDLFRASLDLSRLETSAIPLDLEPTPVAELIEGVANETQALPRKPHVDVTWHVPTDLPILRTDRVKLKVVLRNLVRNALKFTERGNVTVGARLRGNGIEFTVADTGPGMTPATQAVIFEPFCQGNGTREQRDRGVGLGLYLVRRIVDRFGGAITVESDLGRGSCFRVWLPLDAEPDDARP